MKYTKMEFEKYHGLGNDYILLNDLKLKIPEDLKSEVARKLCESHFSIGADGLIYICPSETADIRMRIFNNDGSEAEMCGNGIRCFAKYVYEHGIIPKEIINIETKKENLIAKLYFFDTQKSIVKSAEIDMGVPILDSEKVPVFCGEDKFRCINESIAVLDKIFNLTAVSMGNPHAVIFTDKVPDDNQLNKYGASLESHSWFPNKTNVEFVQVLSDTECTVRVFERGVGITNSCGTGSCAVIVAGTILGKFAENQKILVHNDGGDLRILYNGTNVFMEGPITKVFTGIIDKVEF